jgi:hypothetical protein
VVVPWIATPGPGTESALTLSRAQQLSRIAVSPPQGWEGEGEGQEGIDTEGMDVGQRELGARGAPTPSVMGGDSSPVRRRKGRPSSAAGNAGFKRITKVAGDDPGGVSSAPSVEDQVSVDGGFSLRGEGSLMGSAVV